MKKDDLTMFGMKNGWTFIWKINGKDEWMLMDDDGGLDGNHGWKIDEKLGSRLKALLSPLKAWNYTLTIQGSWLTNLHIVEVQNKNKVQNFKWFLTLTI